MRLTVAVDRQRVHARHGLLPQERKVGNMFEVSVRVWYDLPDDASEQSVGDLTSSVNYAELAEMVKDVMGTPRDLLESVAVAIKKAIVERWQTVKGGSVTVVKLTPPVSAAMQGASVSLEW